VHAPSEEKCDDSKDNIQEELEQVFYHFPKYHMKILLGGENIFKPTIVNEILHKESNDNGVIIVHLAVSTNLLVKSKMFPNRNFHRYTWISLDGKN
jgi:hypothetical protein